MLAQNLLNGDRGYFYPTLTLTKGNSMLKNKLLVAALAAAFAMPVLAEDAPAAAPTSPFSTNVSLVTNYLYRGISQSGANPAIQGGFDYAGASGFYIGTWGSSISWLSDAGVGANSGISNAGLELDTYGGYRFATGPLSYDVGFLRYNYPGTYAPGVTKADTNEIYGAVTYSFFTAKLSYALGDLFGVADAKGSTYIDLTAAYPIGESGYTLGAHYGKQTYKGATTDTLVAAGTDPTYADYKLSVTKDLGTGYSASLTFSSTDAKTGGFYTNLQGKDLGKGTAVVALSRTF
jgi:uncharacterized protein (TIGR02001 family)